MCVLRVCYVCVCVCYVCVCYVCVCYVVCVVCVLCVMCVVCFPVSLFFNARGQMTKTVPDAPPPRRMHTKFGHAESHSPTQRVQKPSSAHGVG